MQKHHFPSSQLNGPKEEYKFVASKRLGRSTYKEQYAFIYRWVSPLCQQVSPTPALWGTVPGDGLDMVVALL